MSDTVYRDMGSEVEARPVVLRAEQKNWLNNFSLERPLMILISICLLFSIVILYTESLGYPNSDRDWGRPTWAIQWTMLIFANISLSMLIYYVGAKIEGKFSRPLIGTVPLFTIALGLVVTFGLFWVTEIFTLYKIDGSGLSIVPRHDLFFNKVYNISRLTFSQFLGTPDSVTDKDIYIYTAAITAIFLSVVGFTLYLARVAHIGESGIKRWLALQSGSAFSVTVPGVDTKGQRDEIEKAIEEKEGLLVRVVASINALTAYASQIETSQSRLALIQGERIDLIHFRQDHVTLRDGLSTFKVDLSRRQTWGISGAGAAMSNAITDIGECTSKLLPISTIFERLIAASDTEEAQLQAKLVEIKGEVLKIEQQNLKEIGLKNADLGAARIKLETEIAGLKSYLGILVGLHTDPVSLDVTPKDVIHFDGNGETVTLNYSEAHGVYRLGQQPLEMTNYPFLTVVTILLLGLNNFIIAPELPEEMGVQQHLLFFIASSFILLATGIICAFAFREVANGLWPAKHDWKKSAKRWLFPLLLLGVSGLIIALWPQPTQPVVEPAKPVSLNCPITQIKSEGANQDGSNTGGTWTFDTPKDKLANTMPPSIDLMAYDLRQCSISLPANSDLNYIVAIGMASEEGDDASQFNLAHQRAQVLIDQFKAQYKVSSGQDWHGKSYALILGRAETGTNHQQLVYKDPWLETGSQRQVLLLAGNRPDIETAAKAPTIVDIVSGWVYHVKQYWLRSKDATLQSPKPSPTIYDESVTLIKQRGLSLEHYDEKCFGETEHPTQEFSRCLNKASSK